MKKVFVRDVLVLPYGTEVTLLGWLTQRKKHGGILFLKIADSSGSIQATATKDSCADVVFETAKKLRIESSVRVLGVLRTSPNGEVELRITNIEALGDVGLEISPKPRSSHADIAASRFADHCLRHRHLFVRNPDVAKALLLRHQVLGSVQQWFRRKGFIEINAPILTRLPLYEDGSVIQVALRDETAFLTQCVGFYLDACAHVFEQVYNIGPSFRGEESKSLRHLMEYWHIKAEIAWMNRQETMELVEDLITTVFSEAAAAEQTSSIVHKTALREAVATPYPRISYADAITTLRNQGLDFTFGTSLGQRGEAALSRQFDGPFWVVGIPRSIEPFPYCIDPDDPRVTLTADLVLPRALGELLGVAEKIWRLDELDERLREKSKENDQRYEWLRQLRSYGSVPRGAFGMGVERLLRWMSGLAHVRDCIPFPRVFHREIYP